MWNQKRRVQREQRKGTLPVQRVRRNSRKFFRWERNAVAVPQNLQEMADLWTYGSAALVDNV
jgi:hypothetical protein